MTKGQSMTCIYCDAEAEVIATKNGFGYCEQHADQHDIWAGPYEIVVDGSLLDDDREAES